MISLNIATDNGEAKNTHLNFIKCRVKMKLTGLACSTDCEICNSTKIRKPKNEHYFEKVKAYFAADEKLDDLIVGIAVDLEKKNNDFFEAILTKEDRKNLEAYFDFNGEKKDVKQFQNVHTFISDINALFSYDWFIGLEPEAVYSAYHLAEKLNIRSCTYCNRIYTTTARTSKNGKLMRPQFDHWFPKSRFPLLALSFFNLIPSCYVCNSTVKRDVILNLKDHIHPYVDDGSLTEFKFEYSFDKDIGNYAIFIKNGSDRVSQTLLKLKVADMYNAHVDELKDLIAIKEAYSKIYIDQIKSFFPEKLSDKEIYRILFGTEFDEQDFHKRPMSKFKKDILEDIINQ